MKSALFSVSSRLFALVAATTILCSFQGNGAVASQVVSESEDIRDGRRLVGRIRYHYYSEDVDANEDDAETTPSKPPCSDVLMIGVGTAMKPGDYDNLATSIVTKAASSSLVVIITDSYPGFMVKLIPKRYATLANRLKGQLGDIIPICTNESEPKVVIGGHSGSGQAAVGAVQGGLLDFVPDGFVGLDPFEISEKKFDFDKPFPFPSMNWGFEKRTCGVKLSGAARGAYRLSSPDTGRVLYLIDNQDNAIRHCVFTDNGCLVICPKGKNTNWLYESIADSVDAFVAAIQPDGEAISKETFALPSTVAGNVTLHVNSDVVSGANVMGGSFSQVPAAA